MDNLFSPVPIKIYEILKKIKFQETWHLLILFVSFFLLYEYIVTNTV
jgi:hypothetical protein